MASFNAVTGLVYNSKTTYDFAYFIAGLYDPTLPSVVEQVRVIRLNLPHDTMACSGILSWLDGKKNFSSLSIYNHTNNHTVFAKDPPPHRRQPGDLGVAADMCRSLLEAHHGNAFEVPHRKWFQVIVRLLRCCKNIETIEVPLEWGDVQWYDNNFPGIDLTDPAQAKRQLVTGRWRWGLDVIVVQPSYILPRGVPSPWEEEVRKAVEEGRSIESVPERLERLGYIVR